jgi:hypothetical protein
MTLGAWCETVSFIFDLAVNVARKLAQGTGVSLYVSPVQEPNPSSNQSCP